LINDNDRLLRKYDLVVIDEITTLPHFAVSPVDLIAEEYLRFQWDMIALTKVLRKAKKVIGMDGYVSTPAIRAIVSISKKKPYLIRKNIKTNKKVEIYLTKKGSEPDLKKNITCEKFMGQFTRDLIKINQNQKLMVMAFSYKKKAKEIAKYIEETVPNSKAKIKLITGDTTKEEETLNIIRDLDLHISDNTCFLIYSPAITTGVDIPQAKKTNVYHVVSGIHLSSHTHYQMTMRGRNAASYKVLFPLFLANKGRGPDSGSNDAKSLFNHKMTELLNTIAFRGRYKLKVLKAATKELNLKMGGLLLFKYLETVETTKTHDYTHSKTITVHPTSKQTILKKLNTADLSMITCEGVKTAVKLEVACLEWDMYDVEYGTLGQYVNLLSREGCLVSKELDVTEIISKKYQRDDQRYVDQILKTIKETLNYHGTVKSKSKTGLYSALNRIKVGQRVMDYLMNNHNYSPETVTTGRILERLLKQYGVTFKRKFAKELTNKDFINMYDSLVTRVYSSDTGIEPEVGMLLRGGVTGTDLSKLRRMTSVLTLFFKVQRKDKNSQALTVKTDKYMLKSLEGIDEKHRSCLI